MKGRLEYIDGLRGIAALLVLAQHTLEKIAPSLFQYVNFGRFGIVLFFLISGFVIPFGTWRSLPDFARLRALRLLPALWFSIALALLAKGGASIETIAADMLMLARPLDVPTLNGAYWTLSYELAFYLVSALLFSVGMLKSHRVIGALAILLPLHALFSGDTRFVYHGCFAVGAMIRMAQEDRSALPWTFAAVVTLTMVSVLKGTGLNSELFNDFSRRSSTALPIVAFVAVVLVKPRVPRVSLWLGKTSYSTYLLQGLFVGLMVPLIGVHPALYVALVFATTLGVAAGVYEYIERPFMEMGRKRRPIEAI